MGKNSHVDSGKSSHSMVKKKSWDEFRKNGMLWFANRILHVFGWAIAVEFDDKNEITDVFPVRVKYRGFCEPVETRGFKNVSRFMKRNANRLLKEALEE